MIGLAISLLTSKVGRYALAVVGAVFAIGAIYGAGNLHGRFKANARWEKLGLENRIKVLEVDLQIQRNIAALAKQAEAGLAIKSEQLELKLQDYTRHVEEGPKTDTCRATDDDVRRLRDLTGGTVDRNSDSPANPKGLRKPSAPRRLPRIW